MANEEPWLRGTLTEYPALIRAVLHALVMAQEDVAASIAGLTHGEILASPHGLSPISFHLRHIPGSLDRLLTYAEDRSLDQTQLAVSQKEPEPAGNVTALLAAFVKGMGSAEVRVRQFASADLEQNRVVGRAQLPSSVGGLLVHCAEHTSRHVGQVVTTAKLLKAMRTPA